MLKIESLKKGKNVIKGSSELRIMQNNYTPVLDLLIRESIQNSLDAKKDDVDFVRVDYVHGKFDVKKVCNEFETIGPTLWHQFNSQASFIAIMDKNTIGLTGNLSGNYDENTKQNENLGKLVFHIMEEQEKEGAGGSWGIGKTLYYRLGKGLVIYYSRVKENGRFQDRLVAAVVEDETKKDGLLSKINGNVGVAWFGNKESNKDIEAVTDSEYISSFLNLFKLEPLSGKETGTYVIIPFINEEDLLNNNMSEYADKAWWNVNIEDYLYAATLRWYFPRFSNYYQNGPKLKVFINKEEVKASEGDNTGIYQKYIEMYDSFYNEKHPDWIKVENIERKTDLKDYTVGKFIYGLVSKDELGVTKYHLPNPKQYALMEDSFNTYPLVCYCRNAGMIINYENFSKNIGIINCPEDKYIIGLFVVDPNNAIVSDKIKIKLDEYLRQSEKSDHCSWEDHLIPGRSRNIKIVDGIYKNIAKVLNNDYGNGKIIEAESTIDISLARRFGSMFLPNAGYGKDPRRLGSGSSNNGTSISTSRKNKITAPEIKYENGKLKLIYEISLNEEVESISFNNMINTINGGYDAQKWVSEGFDYPCNITKIGLICTKKNGRPVNEGTVVIKKNDVPYFKGFNIEFLNIDKKCYSVIMKNSTNKIGQIDFKISIEVETDDKSIQTYCDVNIKGKQ